MTDYTLKFKDEAEANEVLFEKYPLKMDEDLNVTETYDVSRYPEHVIDIIGTIYKDTGVVATYNGVDSPIMAAVPGWHVNVRGPETRAFEAYVVEVATPIRVWA